MTTIPLSEIKNLTISPEEAFLLAGVSEEDLNVSSFRPHVRPRYTPYPNPQLVAHLEKLHRDELEMAERFSRNSSRLLKYDKYDKRWKYKGPKYGWVFPGTRTLKSAEETPVGRKKDGCIYAGIPTIYRLEHTRGCGICGIGGRRAEWRAATRFRDCAVCNDCAIEIKRSGISFFCRETP